MVQKNFRIGDRVEALNETTRGRVVALSGDWVTVESDDGFPHRYTADELILISGRERLSVSRPEVYRAMEEEQKGASRKKPTPARKQRRAPAMEVDLHLNQLVPSTRGMSNYDMLNLQLETARRQLEYAMDKRIQRVVFIHGVGEGVLKEELGYLFGRYDRVTYYDADYQKYGSGATEVYIRQKE